MAQEKKEKCQKCKTRDSTGEDGLCNNCRFMATIDKMLIERQNLKRK